MAHQYHKQILHWSSHKIHTDKHFFGYVLDHIWWLHWHISNHHSYLQKCIGRMASKILAAKWPKHSIKVKNQVQKYFINQISSLKGSIVTYLHHFVSNLQNFPVYVNACQAQLQQVQQKIPVFEHQQSNHQEQDLRSSLKTCNTPMFLTCFSTYVTTDMHMTNMNTKYHIKLKKRLQVYLKEV